MKRRRPRRLVLLGSVLVLALAASAIAITSIGFATSGGDPYSVPMAVDTNPDPNILETTITAEQANVDIGNGVTANAQTFNGQIPGPTLDLKVGDTVIVHFKNDLSTPTGIHWHGIELANAMDGTPFTQNQVEPGGTFLYKFTVDRPGIYWYHPHHHSSTNQVFKGLYGMIIVHDPNEAALQASGTLPPASQTKPLVLTDTSVCKNVGSNGFGGTGDTYQDSTVSPGNTPPWVDGNNNTLPAQAAPTIKNLCQGPAAGADPYPIDENGALRGPFSAGDIPNIQTAAHSGRVNEGQTVLTNGKNVGGRAGGPCTNDANPGPACVAPGTLTPPGALAAGASTLNVQPGQGLRLEILNASTVRFMRLRLTKPDGSLVPLVRVGGEGGLLDTALVEGGTQQSWVTDYTQGEVLLPPGSRADVVAAIPTAPTSGVMTLWTEDYNRTGMGYSNIPTVPVMHLNLSGSTVSPAYSISAGTPLRNATGNPQIQLGAATGSLLNPNSFSPAKIGCSTGVAPCLTPSNITLEQAGNEARINGVFGTHDTSGDYENAPHLGSSRYAKEGDILQMSTTNSTSADHPFHLHGFSIQPLTLSDVPDGGSQTYNFITAGDIEYRDNVGIPGSIHTGKHWTLTFRVKLDPRPLADGSTPGGALGRWVFHCHIFFHAEDGMLSELVVTAPNGNERPDVNVNGSDVTGTQGDTIAMTGTYQDPDGDPVKLSSSIGTVTDTGGGTWSWSLPTTVADQSQIVYITATDSQGLKNQIAFKMNLNPDVVPVVKKLKVVPNTISPPRQSTPLNANISKKKKGKAAKIKFNLSKASTVTFTVQRLKPKKPKVKKTFKRTIKSGGNKTVKFTARFKKKALKPGKYKLTAVATDAAGGKSTTVSTRFKVKR